MILWIVYLHLHLINWGLRDYKTEPIDWGDCVCQLGLEPHPNMFIEHLISIFTEIKRVLKKSGSCYVNLGDTYCGLAWADGDTRDTDWYELVLTSPKRVTLTSSGNFPFVVGFVPTDPPGTGDCADVIGSLDPYETGSPFEEVSVQSDLPAGTHLLFVAPSGFNDYPCPGPWKYYLTIEGQGAVAAGMFLLLLGN